MQAFLLAFILFLGGLVSPGNIFAAVASQSGTTNITVTVGGASLSISGYIAPYASVVLIANGSVVSSTVADANGNFSFNNVPILKGLTSFCLDSIDFKKLGESEACFTIDPAKGLVSKSNIFLPPTLGVFRTEVNVGNKALSFGYGMPGSQVTIHINNQNTCIAQADNTGYYECSFSINAAGQYELTADSVLNKKQSEPPTKKVLIQGLSLPQQVGKVTENGIGKVVNKIFSLPGGIWIWIALVILILLIILIWRLKPGWSPKVSKPEIFYKHAFDFLFKERKLHHWWMKGVGY